MPTNYWTFIENYLPNYSSRGDVLWSDILMRYIDNEEVAKEDLKRIKEEIGLNKQTVVQELKRIDQLLFAESLNAYFAQHLSAKVCNFRLGQL